METTKDGTRTLVTVAVLPSSLPVEIHAEEYEVFDYSARYFSLPQNALVLRREQDSLVAAFTRGSSLVHCQSLTEGQITQRVVQDLNCIMTTLEMQNILLPLKQLVLWEKTTPQEIALLKSSFPLPLKEEECPPPRKPSTSWKLVPSKVGEAKKKREMRQLQRRGIFFLLTIYVIAIAILFMRYLFTAHQVADLRAWQAGHEQTLALVRNTRTTWKELRPAIDQDHYPLELMLHASQDIPDGQLHMTLFEAGNSHILIKGEATNATAAFQFLDKLKGDSHFGGYNWNMAQPRLLPNDLAQFQIEGDLANAN
jgi:hypothetical protein